MILLWARAIKKQRIVRSETMELSDDLTETLTDLFTKMDLPRPMWLGKNDREWEQFRLTSFSKDNFIETIPYDKVEIEQIDPDAKKKKSQDPRNG